MKIGLIDVDGHNYPNIPLMKISAYHKKNGDHVEWVIPIFSRHYDKVYMSKVFSFTPDYPYSIDADEIIKGGSGYAIKLVNGKEIYLKQNDIDLPYEIEHTYPDYSLYGTLTRNKAFGSLTKGCPRQCAFCHVKDKEGTRSIKVRDLDEFWKDQENIILGDPNILACEDWKDLFHQLIESKAKIDFNQGLDVRLADEEKIAEINKLRLSKNIHLAWDNPRQDLTKYFVNWQKYFRRKTGTVVYVLTNFNSTIEEDLYRINTLISLGLEPFVMTYDYQHCDDIHKDLARWVDKRIYKSCKFEDYKP